MLDKCVRLAASGEKFATVHPSAERSGASDIRRSRHDAIGQIAVAFRQTVEDLAKCRLRGHLSI